MSIDDALRDLGNATAAQIRLRAQANLEDTYARLVQLEAQGKARLIVRYLNKAVIDRTWHWNK